MKVTTDMIKELRNMTSASISDCKKALQESGGDMNKAISLLRKLGLELVSKREKQVAREGRIEAYVHFDNKIGVLLEVDCETDFVSRNSEFCQFTKDLAMQIAACNPLYIKREDVPAELLENQSDKEEFYRQNCLLEQPFIKDPNQLVKDYFANIVAKFSENIVIRRFVRYKIGE
ncbi:MAG: elongation factor Ts [Candidatus Omnitrophica bacterium]|nr:elongation factor Ts [Candidatus Omnitrophota bacterium]